MTFLVTLILLSASLLSCGSSRTSPPSHGPLPVADGGTADGGKPFPTDASTAPLDVTIADLAAAGLSVFADADQTSPMLPPTAALEPSPYRVLLDQANSMIAEADARQGMLGSDLDALVMVAPDLPPASYFLAGYVSAAGTPGASLSRKLMGTQDWAHAPTVVYPSLVFALFAADAARYANALAGPAGTTGTAGQPFTLPPGLCSAVQGFIDSTISGFFDALGHLKAPQIPQASGFFGAFTSGIQAALDLAASVVNGVIDAGRFVVVQGVKAATEPLLDAIAKVAGPIGVAVQIVTVLRPWTVQMTADPLLTSRVVEPGPGVPGTVTATVTLPGGLDEWPPLIADCAKVAGLTLPPLKPVGAPVVWTLAQAPGSLVSQNAGAPTVLDTQASASIGYVTTTETAMAALGTAFEGKVTATVSIRRKEIADLQKTVADAVFAQIPGLIRPILQAVLGPAVNAVLGLPPSLLDTHGYQPVIVTYHECETAVCCPPGQKACSGVCVDTMTDEANCGDCGVACPDGQTCAGGVCVPPPPQPKTCVPACPAGQTCQNGNCVAGAIVASCTTDDGKGCNDFTGVNWTLALTKQSCGAPRIWSPSPCATAGRLGTCLQLGDAPPQMAPRDFSFVIRLYPGKVPEDGSPPAPICNTCKSEADCTESFNPMGPANPTHPCLGGCCDLRQSLQDAAIACNCTVSGDPGCPNWTPD